MDLGIAGRSAIVCASSKGLGRACAIELARAGCQVVVNGRDAKLAEATAAEIRAETGAEVDRRRRRPQRRRGARGAVRRLSRARHSRQQQRRPAAARFRGDTREDVLAALEANMLTPIALAQAALPGMAKRGFGRIINITSAGVRAPIAAARRVRRRARRPHRFLCRAPRANTRATT